DATANRLSAVYSNCSITKIRTGFAVPGAELDNIDLVSSSADKMFAEISGEPTRLQLQLGWNSRRGKQRALANAVSVAHLCVTICERRHAQIMRNAWPNVTCSVISAFRVARASGVSEPGSGSRTFKALTKPVFALPNRAR